MRKVTYGGACSLDGFLTGPEGSLDWLHFSADVQRIMTDYWSRVDTILMGRKTWEVAAKSAGDGGGGGGGEMAGITSYIFSRTLKSVPAPAHLVSTDAGDFVRELKKDRGKEICVLGGGELAASLFAAGVIDEVGLNIHPVLLGSGVPTFRDAGRVKLTLRENRTLDGGCVLATYDVARSR